MVLTSHILAEIQERVDRLAIMADGQHPGAGQRAGAARADAQLPLWFDLRTRCCRHGRAGAGALATLRRCSIVEALPGGLRRGTARASPRWPCWPSSPRLGSQVHDLQLREPSLEDVFFGFSD